MHQPINTPVYPYVFVTVQPSVDIHIRVSDRPRASLDASVAAQLSICTDLPPGVGANIEFERQCQPGTSGRYVYVYMQGGPGTNRMNVYEVEVYGDPIEIRMWTCVAFWDIDNETV